MDSGPWSVCEETTVLQGGFLLAEKLSHPKPLIHLSKSDWALVGQPIIHTVEEISTKRRSGSHPLQAQNWKKAALAIIWAKILHCQSEASSPSEPRDIDKWKEDVFFAVGNMIPCIGHTVLFELLKSVKTCEVFVQLLLALPAGICNTEVILFVEHVLQESTKKDVVVFLDVWWEIMKHTGEQQDDTVAAFGTLARQYAFDSSDGFTQSPKRFKSEPPTLQSAAPGACILAVFLEGLKHMKTNIHSPKLKCYALANLADTLSASAFQDGGCVTLPIERYLEKVAKVISVWNADPQSPFHQSSLPLKVKEAELHVHTAGAAPKWQLSPDAKGLGIEVLNDLLLCWGGDLECVVMGGSENNHESYRTIDSLMLLQGKLNSSEHASTAFDDGAKPRAIAKLRQSIAQFLDKVTAGQFSSRNVDVIMLSPVIMTIITEKMYRHKEACSVFASHSEWALSADWVSCLEENQALFREPIIILALLEVVMASGSSNEDHIQRTNRAMGAILACFSELSLHDKNKVLLGVLSTWGRKGLSQKLKTFMADFQDDLTMSFNQITQTASDSGLAKAASALARLALLHPEATLKKACHIAVGNLGAHTFLAQIIHSLPALSFKDTQNSETSASLLADCLKEASWGNLSSDKEERQFLAFLTCLLNPSETTGDSRSLALLGPEEVTRTFVLPHLTYNCPNVNLCLQILNTALGVETSADKTGRHWIMSCSPFSLILSLCKLLDRFTMFWQNSDSSLCLAFESKDLLSSVLQKVCDLVELEAEGFTETWNKSMFWLHRKMKNLDWTVSLRLKNLFGDHFKNEVPSSLFEVCMLSENEWTPLCLPEYGPGTGLLALLECCCLSAAMRDLMLSLLVINPKEPEEVNYFSKGFPDAWGRVFPWRSPREWDVLSQMVRILLQKQLLDVPYTLEYVQFMPLLNLRPFAHDLQFSLLIMRGFQDFSHSSCWEWLPGECWKHIVQLYCSCIAGILESIKVVLSTFDLQERVKDHDPFKEALFVYTQVFCHVLHIVTMMPPDSCEPLYFLSLEILCLYEAAGVADTSTNCLIRQANERHLLHSIIDNVTNKEQRTTLLHKISKLK